MLRTRSSHLAPRLFAALLAVSCLPACADAPPSPTGADASSQAYRQAEHALTPRLWSPDAPPKLKQTNPRLQDYAGMAVALEGDTLVVGAPGRDHPGADSAGAVYVFEHDGTQWRETQMLTASEKTGLDDFGISVDLSGDVLAVGAVGEDSEGMDDHGAVYVFEHDGTAWNQSAKLLADDRADGDALGQSVALSGHRLAVGARWGDAPQTPDSGAVYLFEHAAGQWTQTAKLTAADADGGESFGFALDLDGDRLVAGARTEDDGHRVSVGAAYVFELQPTGWVETQKLAPSDGETGDWFGAAVELDATTMAVGAWREDTGVHLGNGAVYVYEHDGAGWTESQKLLASDLADGDHSGDRFGRDIALFGTTLVVGADRRDTATTLMSGAVYVFEHDGSRWQETQMLVAPDAETRDQLGVAVALTDTKLVAGAPFEGDTSGTARSGAVYTFGRAPSASSGDGADASAGDATDDVVDAIDTTDTTDPTDANADDTGDASGESPSLSVAGSPELGRQPKIAVPVDASSPDDGSSPDAIDDDTSVEDVPGSDAGTGPTDTRLADSGCRGAGGACADREATSEPAVNGAGDAGCGCRAVGSSPRRVPAALAFLVPLVAALAYRRRSA